MSKASKMLGTMGTPPANTVVAAPDDDDDDDTKPKAKLGSGTVIIEGMLQKKSPKGLFKAWQDRYFKLYALAIEYYKKPTDPAPAGNISILSVKFVLAKADRNATRFDLVTGEGPAARTYSMLAKDTKDRDKWVAAITEAVKKAFAPPPDKKEKAEPRTSETAAAKPATPKAAAAATTPKAGAQTEDDDRLPPHLRRARQEQSSSKQNEQPPPSPSASSAVTPTASATPPVIKQGKDTPVAAAAAASTPHRRNVSSASGGDFNFSESEKPRAAATIADTKQNATYDQKRKPRTGVSNPVEPADFQLQVYHTERLNNGNSGTAGGGWGWGTLYHARSKTKANTHYLIHAINKSDNRRTDGERLLNVMRNAKPHPYIVSHVHGGETEDTIFGVYSPPIDRYTSLQAYLRVHRRFPESVVRFIAAQTLLALHHLHDNNQTARNLSSETVHLDADGNALYGDVLFGVDSKYISKEILPPEYQPPETANSRSSDDTRVSDYWRWGILLYELATGVTPWNIPKPDAKSNANGKEEDAKSQPNPNAGPDKPKVAVDGNGVPINQDVKVVDTKGNKEFENFPFVIPYAEELDGKEHFVRCAQIAKLIEDTPDVSTIPLPAGVEVSPQLMSLLKLVLVKDPKQRLGTSATAVQEFEVLRSHPFFHSYDTAAAAGGNAIASASGGVAVVGPSWPTLSNANGGVRFQGAAADWIYRNIFSNHQCVKTHRNPRVEAPDTCRLDIDVVTARGIHGWYRPASTKPDKNDGVTTHAPSTHVKVTLDSETNTTVTVQESDKPKYNGRFNYTINPNTQQWSEVLFEVLEDDKKSTFPLVGSMSIPMHTIIATKNAPEEWYSINDARTGFPFGELRIKYSLSASKPAELSKTTRTGKRFSEYFGYTDFGDPLEFPLLPDYDPTGGKARRPAKGGAGGPKRPIRYQLGNFDLDLSYIVSGKLIAMALPGSSIAHSFSGVAEFLKKLHPNQFRIYNLCSESKYDPSKVGGDANSVVEFPYEELSAPPFPLMLHIVQDMEKHLTGSNLGSAATGGPGPVLGAAAITGLAAGSLQNNSANAGKVAIVHCRTGRGRTGVVICAYLMYTRVVDTADDALMWFASKRTQNVRGVSFPSQIRYLRYFERFLKESLWVARPFAESTVLTLQHVRFTTLPQFNATGGCDPYFVAFGPYPYKTLLYDHLKASGGKTVQFHDKALTHGEIPCGDKKAQVYGDVRFVFYNDNSSQPERMFSFTIHTSFVQNYYVCLTKHEIDGANRDKEGRKFDPNFKVELFFKHEKR